MVKYQSLTTRVDEETFNMFTDMAREEGLTVSAFLREMVEALVDDGFINWDDLCEMSWDDLLGVIDENELDVDPAGFRGLFGKDIDGLRDAIADALELPYDSEDETNEDE